MDAVFLLSATLMFVAVVAMVYGCGGLGAQR